MSTISQAAPSVKYSIGFANPHTHYIEVEMSISGIEEKHLLKNQKAIEVGLPVWTPGSYLVREYARHVEQFQAKDKQGVLLHCTRSKKNTWRIEVGAAKQINISYLVYAYELTVRTSYVDELQAYINGASVFCFFEPTSDVECQVHIQKPANWAKVVTALSAISGQNNLYLASNYDDLVDSPILVGNPDVFDFIASGVKHTMAMVGEGNYKKEKLKTDISKIVEAATEVVGEHPCKEYTFIVHNLTSGGGGLEHSHSTSLVANKNGYTNEKEYYGFLSLVAHEYFHLWNVKRIRPIELGPFNYNEEVYCKQLWTAEGWTSYLDDFIMYRAGLCSVEKFYEITCSNLNYVFNAKGNLIQSLADAGFDAWIKYYRPHENSSNSTTNYYTKGAVASLALDITILQATEGKANLDNLLKRIWNDFYKAKNSGFSELELEKTIEKLVGKSIKPFMQKWIYSSDPIDMAPFFQAVGLKLENKNEGIVTPTIGAVVSNQGGKFMVTQTIKSLPAYEQGVYVNDEILTVDHQRVTIDFNAMLAGKKPGDMVHLTLVRKNGELRILSLPIVADPQVSFKLTENPAATPDQLKLRQAWLRKKA